MRDVRAHVDYYYFVSPASTSLAVNIRMVPHGENFYRLGEMRRYFAHK